MLWFPLDGLIELNHALFASGRADEPAVEWIVEHWFVGAPAVWIVVHVLLNLEGSAFLLHANAHVDVEVLGLAGSFLVIFSVDSELGIVGILYPCAGIFLVEFYIHEVFNKVGVKVIDVVVLTCEVNHWAGLKLLVNHVESWNASSLGHIGVVGTKGGCNVHDTCTIVGGNIVAWDNAEAVVVAHYLVVDFIDWLNPWE